MHYPIDPLSGSFVAETIIENITQTVQVGAAIYRFGKALENGYIDPNEVEDEEDDDYAYDDYDDYYY